MLSPPQKKKHSTTSVVSLRQKINTHFRVVVTREQQSSYIGEVDERRPRFAHLLFGGQRLFAEGGDRLILGVLDLQRRRAQRAAGRHRLSGLPAVGTDQGCQLSLSAEGG